MSIHRYTSRGRTKQPKNLKLNIHNGTTGQPITFAHFRDSGSVDVVTSAHFLDNDLTSSIQANIGYNTENQQYLHLCVRTTGSVQSTGSIIDVYGYIRQFGVWGQLKVPLKQDQSNLYDTTINVQVSGSPNSTHYISLPINGVDRVGFVCSDTQDVLLYVAGSTF